MNPIADPGGAAIDFTIDRFSDSFATLFEPSTTITRTPVEWRRSRRASDNKHRRRHSGRSAVVPPIVVIGRLSSTRGLTAKIGEREAQRFAGDSDQPFERSIELQD